MGARLDNDRGTWSGSAYVFERTGSVWDQTAKLLASRAMPADWYGFSVSIDPRWAVVGAVWADANGTDSGGVYVYEDGNTGWAEAARFTGSDSATNDGFGWAVAVSDDFAIIGALQDEDHGDNSGSAYVFRIPEPATLSLLTLGGLAVIRRRRR